MKMWKIAAPFYGVYDPEYARNHDYEPEQDQNMIVRPRGKMMEAFKQAATDIQNKHMEYFKGYFTRFRIEFVKDIGFLAKYINGTYHEPVIVIDLRECAKTQRQMKDQYPSMYHIAITTLMHELKHATQDAEDRFPHPIPHGVEDYEEEDRLRQGKLEDLEYEAEEFGMRFR